MDTTQTTTHVGLCAGYGGIELGLKRVIPNLRSVALCEIEAFACANLVAKMEAGLLDAAPIWTDLKTFPWDSFRGKVDILTGGYPCQPFSAAGKRQGADDPRHLWPFISAGIAAMRPSVCFFENVEGHISLGLPDVIEDLAGLGYRTTWGIFSAAEVGAPHQRKRVFILAHRECEGLERFYNRNTSAEPSEYVSADAWASSECGTWPSRPGEQQFAWEPPRVVAHSHCNGSQEPEYKHADLPTEPSGRNAESVGNAAESRFPISRGKQISLGESREKQESQRSNEAMGNAEQFLLPTSREHGAMDEACGIPTDRKGGESTQANSVAGTSRKREGDGSDATECCEAQPTLGRDADGSSNRMDDAELFVTSDNRTDELRLLGNGVVPATAEQAFRILSQQFNS